ncbi:MAG: hypothetical protein GWM98_25940 [Nitrospinaceae bacterium]|nr:hypothetical protein [Nitrospinaceae bacterium]NIR57282.1 hypothetical protein [Nitrospinaceae bacterium]NIS87734.1 hypothetical protein [Nitrospinaceae bacterium]NIT84600.1 hypothetical protein [Nitrospinaceae bacterium]NIU46783.1 hypothetical protein [Nitrospinaceae bacterium]
MRFSKAMVWAGVLAGWLALAPVTGWADVPQESDCKNKNSLDERNFCLAMINDHGEAKNRYKNKDHSSYYCSLIRDRDKQNLCQAIIDSDSNRCALIGDKNMEKECRSKTGS